MISFKQILLYIVVRMLIRMLHAALKRLPGDEDVFHCLGLLNMAIENQLKLPDYGRF